MVFVVAWCKICLVSHDLSVLLTAMTSADPDVRDGWAYAELAHGIAEGRFVEEHPHILALAAARLSDQNPWTRSFAALAMTWLAEAGAFTQGSFRAFSAWYPEESDTRGFVPQIGWIHAVAHGADYLGSVARHGFASPTQILSLLSARVVGPGEAWVNQEDARITRSALAALADCDSVTEATDWLHPVTARLDTFEDDCAAGKTPPSPPPWIHNTTMTCTKLHLALGLQANHDRIDPLILNAVTAQIEQTVLRVEPFITL